MYFDILFSDDKAFFQFSLFPDKRLLFFLKVFEIEYNTLRYLVYHRDVITFDNYYRFDIPKKNGKMRHIAAPKTCISCISYPQLFA